MKFDNLLPGFQSKAYAWQFLIEDSRFIISMLWVNRDDKCIDLHSWEVLHFQFEHHSLVYMKVKLTQEPGGSSFLLTSVRRSKQWAISHSLLLCFKPQLMQLLSSSCIYSSRLLFSFLTICSSLPLCHIANVVSEFLKQLQQCLQMPLLFLLSKISYQHNIRISFWKSLLNSWVLLSC